MNLKQKWYWFLESLDVLFDRIDARFPRLRPLTSRVWSNDAHVPHGDYDNYDGREDALDGRR